jgi:hypothetical protein
MHSICYYPFPDVLFWHNRSFIFCAKCMMGEHLAVASRCKAVRAAGASVMRPRLLGLRARR